jgi:hypothetical protein
MAPTPQGQNAGAARAKFRAGGIRLREADFLDHYCGGVSEMISTAVQ